MKRSGLFTGPGRRNWAHTASGLVRAAAGNPETCCGQFARVRCWPAMAIGSSAVFTGGTRIWRPEAGYFQAIQGGDQLPLAPPPSLAVCAQPPLFINAGVHHRTMVTTAARWRPFEYGWWTVVIEIEDQGADTIYLTTQEACAMLRISRSTWFNIRRRGAGPRCVRLGRGLYWSKAALIEWLRDCEGSSDLEPRAPRHSPPVAVPVAKPSRRPLARPAPPPTVDAIHRRDVADRRALDEYARLNAEEQ